MGRDQLLRYIGFTLYLFHFSFTAYTPFHFSFTVPLRRATEIRTKVPFTLYLPIQDITTVFFLNPQHPPPSSDILNFRNIFHVKCFRHGICRSRSLKGLLALFQATLITKRTMTDLQLYPWNNDLIKNVGNTVVFLTRKVFILIISPFLLVETKCASHFCRETENENEQFEGT